MTPEKMTPEEFWGKFCAIEGHDKASYQPPAVICEFVKWLAAYRATQMELIPADTVVFEPDGIHQVTLQFKSENDAIVFYEGVAALAGRK